MRVLNSPHKPYALQFLICNANGTSSGVVTMWDPLRFFGTLISSSNNFLAARLFSHNTSWFLINVFAPNTSQGHLTLWNGISLLIQNDSNAQWMVVGDFNSPHLPSEKFGAILDYSDIMMDWANFISRNGLLDVDLIGQKLYLVQS